MCEKLQEHGYAHIDGMHDSKSPLHYAAYEGNCHYLLQITILYFTKINHTHLCNGPVTLSVIINTATLLGVLLHIAKIS